MVMQYTGGKKQWSLNLSMKAWDRLTFPIEAPGLSTSEKQRWRSRRVMVVRNYFLGKGYIFWWFHSHTLLALWIEENRQKSPFFFRRRQKSLENSIGQKSLRKINKHQTDTLWECYALDAVSFTELRSSELSHSKKERSGLHDRANPFENPAT